MVSPQNMEFIVLDGTLPKVRVLLIGTSRLRTSGTSLIIPVKGLPVTSGICYPLGLYGLYKCFKIHKIAKIMALSLFLNLFFLELGPHKEFRFIQNAIPGKKHFPYHTTAKVGCVFPTIFVST